MNDLTLNTVSAPVPGERAQLSGRDMLALLRDHILEVLGVAACVVALAVAYVTIATPEYQADVLVRIDPPEPNALGINSQGPLVTPPAPSPSTEMAVMTSRSVYARMNGTVMVTWARSGRTGAPGPRNVLMQENR